MEARSGSRARSGTGRLSISPFPSWRKTSLRCSACMPDAATAGASGSFTVLVADDNDVAQRLCKRVLEKAGYVVLIAADGLQAAHAPRAHPPPLILMHLPI